MVGDAISANELVTIPAWVAWLVIFGMAATAITGIWRLLRRLGRNMSFAANWVRTRATEALEGVVMEKVSPELGRIEKQLESANGGSLREKINEINAKLDEHLEWSAQVVEHNKLARPDDEQDEP